VKQEFTTSEQAAVNEAEAIAMEADRLGHDKVTRVRPHPEEYVAPRT
jgi:hypothetical protein